MGYATTLAISYGAWIAFVQSGYRFYVRTHPVLGLLAFILLLIVVLLGVIAILKRKFESSDWQTARLIWWSHVHSSLAYFLIFFS